MIYVTNYKFRIRIDVCTAADAISRVPFIHSLELYTLGSVYHAYCVMKIKDAETKLEIVIHRIKLRPLRF